MIIADTDVLIDYLEGRNPGAEAVFQALRRDQLQTTTINYFELLAGARRRRQQESVLALLESIQVLPLDVDAARRAAGVRRQLERSGIGIGMGDSLIAGIALARGASLLTRNKRHFERVLGLPLAELQP
jgi:predicted nucleic acid-binding protein